MYYHVTVSHLIYRCMQVFSSSVTMSDVEMETEAKAPEAAAGPSSKAKVRGGQAFFAGVLSSDLSAAVIGWGYDACPVGCRQHAWVFGQCKHTGGGGVLVVVFIGWWWFSLGSDGCGGLFVFVLDCAQACASTDKRKDTHRQQMVACCKRRA